MPTTPRTFDDAAFPTALVDYIAHERCVIVAGSGLSRHGARLPTWGSFVKRTRERLKPEASAEASAAAGYGSDVGSKSTMAEALQQMILHARSIGDSSLERRLLQELHVIETTSTSAEATIEALHDANCADWDVQGDGPTAARQRYESR